MTIQTILHRYHDLRRTPVALYQLAGNLNDSSGNAHHLSVGAGAERYTDCSGFLGAWFDAATSLNAASSAAFQITGALSISAIVLVGSVGARRTLVYHGNPGTATAADNTLYAVTTETNTGVIRLTSQSGSGTIAATSFVNGVLLRTLYHVCVTRSAGGSIGSYINGELFDSGSITVPTSGTSGVLRIGGGESSELFLGFLCSVQICDRELTAAEVYEDATYTGFAGNVEITSDDHFPEQVAGRLGMRQNSLYHPHVLSRNLTPGYLGNRFTRKR